MVQLSRVPNEKFPQEEPPEWLRNSDESWGPADPRKRKAYPIERPKLPAVWFSKSRHSPLHVIVYVLVFALLVLLLFWIGSRAA
jgi:hypothetical protein